MSQYKKTLLKSIFVLLLCFIIAFNNKFIRIFASHDQAFYFVVAGIISDGQLGHLEPKTRIVKLSNKSNEKGVFEDIQVLNSIETSNINIYHNYGFLKIDTRDYDSYEDKSVNINIILMTTPWTKKTFKALYSDIFFPLRITDEVFLVSYRSNYDYKTKNYKPEASLINIKTLLKMPEKLEILSEINTMEWFNLRNKQLVFTRIGLENIYFPFVPPMELLGDIKDIHLITNCEKYVVLRIVYQKEVTKVFKLQKLKNLWSEYVINGNETYVYVINPFIICNIGSVSPKGELYPTVFTGEWVLINLETGQQQTIKLKPVSKIIYASDNCLLSTNDRELLYIPVIDGKAIMDKSIVLYKDSNNVIGTADEIVNYIQGAFLGPKEVPEQ